MDNIKYRYGTVRDIPNDVEESRTITFIASTYAKDRHGTVLNQKNWRLDNFNRNPIIGYQHNVYGDMCNAPNPDDVIGKGRAYVQGDQLLVDVEFEPAEINEQADKIFQKVRFGSLNATSVGFSPFGVGSFGEGEEREGGANQTYYFEGQELLELSIVNIPSNPEAMKKSVRDQTAGALLYIKRALGETVNFSDIEKMTVAEVLRSLERGHKVTDDQVRETIEGMPNVLGLTNAEAKRKKFKYIIDNI